METSLEHADERDLIETFVERSRWQCRAARETFSSDEFRPVTTVLARRSAARLPIHEGSGPRAAGARGDGADGGAMHRYSYRTQGRASRSRASLTPLQLSDFSQTWEKSDMRNAPAVTAIRFLASSPEMPAVTAVRLLTSSCEVRHA